MRPCGQLPTIHSEFVARGGQREGIGRAGVAIRKTDVFFETPSPPNRSSRGMIFQEAGSRSMRVQTE
jgi:hypothetical protein